MGKNGDFKKNLVEWPELSIHLKKVVLHAVFFISNDFETSQFLKKQ